MKNQKSKLNKWLWLGVASELLSAPNTPIMKISLQGMNVPYFTLLRYVIICIICLPAIIEVFSLKKLTKKSMKYLLFSSICLASSALSFNYALTMTNASYASILSLGGPIFFIPLSVRMEGDKINRRALLGLALAAAGAFAIIGLPIALAQNASFDFNPLASLLLVINLISWSLFIIFYRKANEEGLKLNSIMGINAIFNVVVFGILFLFTSYAEKGFVDLSLTNQQIFGVVFSALAVTYVSKKWRVLVYEKTGPVIASALDYFGLLSSILISIIFLNEKLSIFVVLGGIMIILGVYVAEHHKSEHHKHIHIAKHS
jgi:drug/metabolite transporter (DMT)-like permease